MHGRCGLIRIATYNLWNAVVNWPQRLAGIAEELRGLDADIVAAQEAPTQAFESMLLADYLRGHTPYPHVLHLPYNETPRGEDRPEGLAFLSKLPLTDVRVELARRLRQREQLGGARCHRLERRVARRDQRAPGLEAR